MSIVFVLRWLLLVMQALLACPILYLCGIAASAILTDRKRRTKNLPVSSTAHAEGITFAILIPAHNEETVIGTLLESLSSLKYPQELHAIYIVADNCTDSTVEIARKAGRVHVYERLDEEKRGKGYALQWLLDKLEEDRFVHDAYIVLDADSIVSPTFLQAMAKELAQGALALQASNTVLNTADSPSTVLRWIALTLMNHVRPLGRNGLGFSSTLTGNGMCLSRTILTRYPWQSHALAEDYHYYLMLVSHGERVRYVPAAVVRSQMPSTFTQMRTQDIRWESAGGGEPSWRIALRLLGAGLRSRNLVSIEAVAELLTPPLSFLVLWCSLTLLASLLLWSSLEIFFSLLLIAGLLYYIGTAFYMLRPPRAVYKAILYAPGFMIWKLRVYFLLSRSKKHTNQWIRTERTVSTRKTS
jgi:cellulose synthase/poly-beta-1,6-N-acetylglucosamine synthase-like glycosyltransferase